MFPGYVLTFYICTLLCNDEFIWKTEKNTSFSDLTVCEDRHECSSSGSSTSSVVSSTQVVDLCVQSTVWNNFQSQKKSE